MSRENVEIRGGYSTDACALARIGGPPVGPRSHLRCEKAQGPCRTLLDRRASRRTFAAGY